MIIGAAIILRPSDHFLFEVQKSHKWRIADGATEIGIGCIGGGIEPGETPMQALMREVSEEAQCEVQLDRPESLFYLTADIVPIPLDQNPQDPDLAFLWAGYKSEHRKDCCVAVYRGTSIGSPTPGDLAAILSMPIDLVYQFLDLTMTIEDVLQEGGILLEKEPIPRDGQLLAVGTVECLTQLYGQDPDRVEAILTF